MAKNVDVFGFDELEKAFNRMEKKYLTKRTQCLWRLDRRQIKDERKYSGISRNSAAKQ